jgi:hypothetical protein
MKTNDVDALNAPFAHYVWPDIQSCVSSFSGKMEYPNLMALSGYLAVR